MVNRPKNIGTAAETAVVRAARRLGFPQADRLTLTGNKDRGDIGLCPGVVIEVKGGQLARTASDLLIAAWLIETEIERGNAGAEIAFLVTQRAGIGTTNAHRWWAHFNGNTTLALPPVAMRMQLVDTLRLLRAVGYGTPLPHGDPLRRTTEATP